MIERLESMAIGDRPDGLVASVRPDAVVLSDDGGAEVSLPLEDEAFYVSNRADGATLVDETMTTNDNGFVGLWLPRDLDATVTVRSGDRVVTAPLSTDADAPTCVTTLQLA